MTNMKKLGLSALAGSLVAFSANAAELSVSGGVELTYTDTGGNTGNEVTGNSYGANSSVTLSGSGDVGFGTVSMTRTLNDTNGGWGSSFQTLDMGDMGVLSFDSTGGALVGITANDDLLPTAYEEAWTGVSGSGVSGVGSTNVIGYRNHLVFSLYLLVTHKVELLLLSQLHLVKLLTDQSLTFMFQYLQSMV